MRTAINTCLTLLLLLSVFLSAYSHASDESSCPLGISTGNQTWDGRIYGDAPYLCLGSAGNCQYRLDYTSVCSNVSYECDGTFVSTGDVCTESEGSNGDVMWPGGDLLEEPDGGDGSDDGGPDGSINKGTVCVSSGCYDFNVDLSWIADEFDVTKGLLRSLSSTEQIHFESLKSGQLTIRDTVMNNTSLVTTMRGEVSSLTKDVKKIGDSITNFDVDLSDLDPKFAELQSSLSGLNGMSNYYFNSIMGYVADIPGHYSSLDTNLAAARNDVYRVKTEMQNQFSTQNAALTANQQALGDSLATLSSEVSGLADGLEALSSQISGASGTGDVDLSGVESKLQGIQETLDGKGLVGRPFEGQVDFEGNGLYGSDAIDKLQGEIEQLQEQYQEQMGQFKSLFTFDESQLNSGEYVKHEWTFTFANGRTNSFSSGVFPALLQNANFIAAVLLFLAVLLGIKALTD
ncbi:hypothetical protein SKP08_003223 [Vibrio fluvialis]|nr:hypothetical protein [Vibrio fluvialis]